MRYCFLILSCLLPIGANAIGLYVSSTSCEDIYLPSSSLTGAGDYHPSKRRCTARITITDTTKTWSLKATISPYNSNLPLYIQRTGGASTSLSGGSNTQLTGATQELFTGEGTINDIPLQIEIWNLDANDGNGKLINNATISYEVVTTN